MDIIQEYLNNDSTKPECRLSSFVMKNENNVSVTVLNYGATIARIDIPDKHGQIENITLGHKDLKNFIGGPYYLGSTIGRYANRIANGRFKIEGKEYNVSLNRPGLTLHGGFIGYDKKYWQPRIAEILSSKVLELTLVSFDGEEGFPGTMEVKVIYSLTEKNELVIKYMATSDKTTVINLTNHSYFNLTGNPNNSILNHKVKINADNFTPTDSKSIPTGEISSVRDTPLDFRRVCRVGDRIKDSFEQLRFAKGYDHNFVLNNYNGDIREAATVYDPKSGRFMEVLTDQPGMQFYSGNFLNGIPEGMEGVYPKMRTGLCFECQHFPNSPNEKKFPSVILKPGEIYRQTTIYRFSVY